MQTTIEQSATNKQATIKPYVPDFGNGRQSPLMSETFKAARVVFQVNDKTAEKIARQVGSDIGAHQAKSNGSTIKLTGYKAKDNKVNIKEAVKAIKGVTCTDSMNLLRALQFAGEAGEAGFNYGFTTWKLSDEMQAVLAKFEVAE